MRYFFHPLSLTLLCLLVGVAWSQDHDGRSIRHAWAPSTTAGASFSWNLQWKGLDPVAPATLQSVLPPGLSFDAATSRFSGIYNGAAPSSYETNLTFSSATYGQNLVLQVHFTFFPAGGYQYRRTETIQSYTSAGPYTPGIISEQLVISPPLTGQIIPSVPQNDPYNRNESIDFVSATVSSTNVVVAYPTNLPAGQRAPILLWMHGNSYYGEYYIEIMKIVASHGIAMVAPNYLAWSIGTGEVQERARLLNLAINATYEWCQNISSPLFEKLDLSSGYVIGGHSWGGATASLYSLQYRAGVRGSILMDEIAMVSNPDYYPRRDGLRTTLPYWYTDPTPFAELPMLYFRAPRSLFNEGLAEAESAYASSPFTTIVSVTDAFHESFLDAYPAPIVDPQVANSTRQTAAHFIVSFMKRVVQNELIETDILLGPDAAALASRTAPFASLGVSVTTSDPSNQLIIEDFRLENVNSLGHPTERIGCNNRTLPGLWDVVAQALTMKATTSPSWQWLHMNISRDGPSASWSTIVGSVSNYADYTRVCTDVMFAFQGYVVTGAFVHFPDDVSLTFNFTLLDGSVVRKSVGQDITVPDPQIAVLFPLCVSLNSFSSPIQAISMEAHVPSSSSLTVARILMDRVRLEKYAIDIVPSSTAPFTAPDAIVSQQPQASYSPKQPVASPVPTDAVFTSDFPAFLPCLFTLFAACVMLLALRDLAM